MNQNKQREVMKDIKRYIHIFKKIYSNSKAQSSLKLGCEKELKEPSSNKILGNEKHRCPNKSN